jgi:TonB family protein
MERPVDILDQHEPLKIALLGSIVLHGTIAASILVYNLAGFATKEHWGEPSALPGGSVAITPVKTIPLPSNEGKPNPVANDTESIVPSKPTKAVPKHEITPDPDAIPLKSREALKKLRERKPPEQKTTYLKEHKPNQVYSQEQALNNPMISRSGSGDVGSGQSSPLGSRFGWYEQILREKVSRNWHTEDIDSRLSSLPPAIVTFVIMRDGSVRNIQLSKTSGNFAVDQSALRAIQASIPFPKLPPQYEKDSANLEFWFRLQR